MAINCIAVLPVALVPFSLECWHVACGVLSARCFNVFHLLRCAGWRSAAACAGGAVGSASRGSTAVRGAAQACTAGRGGRPGGGPRHAAAAGCRCWQAGPGGSCRRRRRQGECSSLLCCPVLQSCQAALQSLPLLLLTLTQSPSIAPGPSCIPPCPAPPLTLPAAAVWLALCCHRPRAAQHGTGGCRYLPG